MFRFLIKSVFWIGLAFLVMPQLMGDEQHGFFNKTTPTSQTEPENGFKLPDFRQAGKSVAELEQLCKNFSQYCEDDNSIFSNILNTTLASAGQLLDFLSNQFTEEEESVDTILRDAPKL